MKKNKKQNIVIIFLVIIILVLAGLFAIFYLKNENNDKNRVNENVKEEKDNNKKEIISKDKYGEYEKILEKYSNIGECYDIFKSYNYEKNTIDNNYLIQMAFRNTGKMIEINVSNIKKSEKEIWINDEYFVGKSYEDMQNTINSMFYKKYTLKKNNTHLLRYIVSDDAFVDIADLGFGYGCAGGFWDSRLIFNIEKNGNKLEISVVDPNKEVDESNNRIMVDKNKRKIKYSFNDETNKYTIEGNIYNSEEEFIEKYKERFEQIKFVFILDGITYKLSHLEKIN